MHLPHIEVGSTYRPQYSFPQVTDISNARDYARVVEMPYDTGSGLENGQVYVANDSRFTAGAYNQALTTFAVGGWNNTGLEQELMLYTGAPVMVSRRFNYKVWSNAEALKSDLTDDIRATGGDFKEVRIGNTEVSTQVANRGLIMVLDKDELAEGVMTENDAVAYLTNRLKLNQIRRASALLIAAATDQARTWTSGTRDADMDMITEVNNYQAAAGIGCNTVLSGRAAWVGRLTTLRALATAGGFAGAAKNEQELAAFLNVGTVARVNATYQSATATKTVVGSSKIIFFNRATSGMKMDPSNIKYFWAPTSGGGPISAFRYEEGAKRVIVGVETNELLAITYSGGIRTLTIS